MNDTTTQDELVARAAACPSCGEQRMDWLIWDEDGETVKCDACGTRYSPE